MFILCAGFEIVKVGSEWFWHYENQIIIQINDEIITIIMNSSLA